MTQEKVPVFRVVDGSLVRVPGDVRDPKRRYSSVTSADDGQSYLREFTDEEEHQRDAEEAEWEAQRPQRDAEASVVKKKAQCFRDSLKYESRLVVFLDILGWSHAIAASVNSLAITQSLGLVMKGMGTHVEFNAWQRQHGGPGGWPGDPMVTHFSDSLLISFAADQYAQMHLESTLASVISTLLFNGFVARGAVSCGLLIHRESLAYGPAMIRAHELENTEAKVPRVILDRTLAQVWGQGIPVYNRDGSVLSYRKSWRQDDDGWFFFDYLSDEFKMPGMEQAGPSPAFKAKMDKWRELLVPRLTEHIDSPSVLGKYAWLARYFNTVCAENPQDDIDPIPPIGT